MENLNKNDLEEVKGGSIVESYVWSNNDGCWIHIIESEKGTILKEKTRFTDPRIRPQAGPPIPTF